MSQSRAWTWRQAIADSDLPGDARHILLTLSLFMNDMGGSCFPSIETLVQKTGKSKRTVLKYLAIAKKDGWIDVEQVKRTSKDSDNRGWKRNEYTASWPDENMQSEAVETSNANDSHAEKGSAPHAPPSEEGGASDAKGGAPDANKVVRHTHPNTPENLSNESLHSAQAPEKGEREDSSIEGDDKKTISSQFKVLVGKWPSALTDNWARAEKEWNILTDDQRHAALERVDDYIDGWKKSGRGYSVALSRFIKDLMWERLSEATAKPEQPGLAKKYGKEWFAYRMWLLQQPKRPWRPRGFIAKQVADGKSAMFDDARWHAEYPVVYEMDELARGKHDLMIPRDIEPLSFDKFQKVKVGSDAYNAWGEYHHDKDWPWVNPPKYIEWIWLPSEFPPAIEAAAPTASDDETEEFLRATQ